MLAKAGDIFMCAINFKYTLYLQIRVMLIYFSMICLGLVNVVQASETIINEGGIRVDVDIVGPREPGTNHIIKIEDVIVTITGIQGNDKKKAEYIVKGYIYEGNEQIDQAIDWYNQAVKLGNYAASCRLAKIYTHVLYSNYSEAFKQANLCLKTKSNSGYELLSILYFKGHGTKVNCEKSVYYLELSSQNIDDDYYKNNLAYILAACPYAEGRNVKKALTLAKKLSLKNAGHFDTLALAYAANGLFRQAVQTQKKAIAMVEKLNQPFRLKEFKKKLKYYEQNKQWLSTKEYDEVRPF